MIELLKQPWPWYVAGPLIGLTVPALLLVGNKALGISSSLRHICAACVPAGIPFLSYNWRAEMWNLVFVLGIALGQLMGAAPLLVLFGGGAGAWLLVVGTGLVSVGLLWSDAITVRVLV